MAAPSTERAPGPKALDGRVLPHNIEAEHALLSAVMLSHAERPDGTHALDQVVAMLRPEHFFSGANKHIYGAALSLYLKGEPTDVVHVVTELRERDRLAQIGGHEHLAKIMNEAPAVAFLEKYARLVVDAWLRRQLILKCQRIAGEGYGRIEDTKAFLASSASELEQLATVGPDSIELEEIGDLTEDEEEEDKYLVPALRLCEGRTALVVGDSYTGKSVIAQSIAISICTGIDVWGVFHVEQVGSVLHLNYDQSGKLAKRRYRRIGRARGLAPDALKGKLKIAQFPKLYLDDDAADAKLARLVRGYKLCIVDALVGFVKRTEERSEQMGRLLLQLMRVSERTGCTFLVIHHTSKPSANMKGSPRSPKDKIRGSGSIFGAADTVLVLESTGKKKPVKVSHEKAPTDGQTLDDFYLSFEDVPEPIWEGLLDEEDAPKRPRRMKWGLDIKHVDPEQYKAMQAPREAKIDKAAAFEQLCTRVLELVKAHPNSTGNQLFERADKVRKESFFAALHDLARVERRGGARVVGTPGPRGSTTWRAI